jgi:hypothetical protein
MFTQARQYNAVLDKATTEGTNIYGNSWTGPPNSTYAVNSQLAAARVLIAGIGLASQVETPPSSTSIRDTFARTKRLWVSCRSNSQRCSWRAVLHCASRCWLTLYYSPPPPTYGVPICRGHTNVPWKWKCGCYRTDYLLWFTGY